MEKKNISTMLAHMGGAENSKKMHAGASVPKVFPIYMTSVFSFDDVPSLDAVYDGTEYGHVYSRNSNPNAEAVEEMLAAIEGAEGGVVFSTGMAAITASIIANVGAGDHIVASPVLYGGVYDYFKNELPKFGVEVTFVDFEDTAAFEAAFRPNTKIVYTETITNPLMEVVDIPAVAEIAHAHGCKLIIDNTFATPVVAKPLELGADTVVYSATKYLAGHSDIMGGAILSNAADREAYKRVSALYGASMSPFDAWLLARSLRTLDLRVKQHSENALKVAEFLEKHPMVEKVHYPGLASSKYRPLVDKLFEGGRAGGMLSVDIAGGEENACKFIEYCPTIKFVPSLAGFATTTSYPARTSHRAYSPEDMAAAGITMGTLRISIGIEDADDIIAEMKEALDKL